MTSLASPRQSFDIGRLARAVAPSLPLIVFLAMFVYLGIASPSFLEPSTFALILKQSIPTTIVSLGLATVVMAGGDDVVSGGIDLSIPAAAVLAAAVVADLVTNHAWFIGPALLIGLLTAVACGLVNAFLVVLVGMTPLLATFASATAFVGIGKVVTASRRINVTDPLVVWLRDGVIAGVPVGVIAACVISAVFYFVLHRTRWGLNLQAVGGNRDAAEISGLSPAKFIATAFVIAGLAAGIGSIFVLARGSGWAPGTEENMMMEMVLATFLGAAFSPRRIVTLWGAVLGAVLVSALSVGFGSVGIDIFWTGCIKGGLILVVVASSALSRKVNI
ncbi:MAG: ABC transporter permease [Ancalomicrobiaceae bacterium]|nr:ABC transporter permease [Ancalomicrobiaceae bacterium]